MNLKLLLGFLLNVPLWKTSLALCDFWLSPRILSYFTQKNVRNINAVMCSTKDSFDMLNCFAKGANRVQWLLGVTSNLNIENAPVDIRSGVFIDLTCEKNLRLLRGVSEGWFTIQFTWFLWDPDDNLAALKSTLPILTFSEVGQANHDRVIRMYKAAETLPIVSYEECRWNEETKEFVFIPNKNVIDYQQTPIRTAIRIVEDIYNQSLFRQQLEDDLYMPGKDVSNRYMIAFTEQIAVIYNFSVEILTAGDWGDPDENGTYTGVMGLLQQSKAELTASLMMPEPQRTRVGFVGVPCMPYWMAVVFKQPRALGTYRALILELSSEVWAIIGFIVILGAGVISLTIKYGKGPQVCEDVSFSNGFLQSVGVMANQGLTYEPVGNASRLACLTLLVVSMMVAIYYNAATMTALLSESPLPIKNLEALIQSKIPLIGADAPYILNIKSRRKLYHDFALAKMNKNLKICTVPQGIQEIVNGSAFTGDYLILYEGINSQLKSDAICDLTIFHGGSHFQGLSFTRLCPHLREMYLRGQMRTKEHGLLDKERQRWLPRRPVCARVREFIYVSLEAVSVALGIFLCGTVFSISILFAETFLHRRTNRAISSKWARDLKLTRDKVKHI